MAPAAGPAPSGGVSSFGLGGTNAHLVLEQWSATPMVGTPEDAAPPSPELLLLSARTAEALDVATHRLGEFLAREPELGIDDVAHTLRVGRRAFAHRRAVLAGTMSAAAAELLAMPQGTSRAADVAARVGLLLPGGGSQHVDMARGLYAAEPCFREELDACVQICSDLTGHDLLQWILPSDTDRNAAEPVLAGVQWGLPSLFAVEHALAQWWIRRGVQPKLLLGHSLGEYVAACLAGVFPLEDALRVVIARSELMATAPRGAMLSVALGVDEVVPYLVPGLDVSAVNAADSCVLGGPVDVIADADRRLQDDDVETHRVQIEVASHSALMGPVATALVDVMRTVRLSTPKIPVVSNLTGTWLTDEQALDPGYWGEHLQRTVRFADCLMTTATSADLLLEVGPGQTLSGYARAAFQDGGPRVVASMRHRAQEADDSAVLRQAAGRLWEAGVVGLDLTPARKRREPRRVGLPTYAFQHLRYWIGDPPRDDSVPAAPRPTATPALTAPGTPDVVPESAGSIATAAVDPLTWATEGICEILSRLSGREVGVQDRDTRFLDLGFDSLFLTQANTAFRKAFGVRITFRQLFEQAPTVNSLAAYVAERASPPAPPPPASTDQTAEAPGPAGSGADAMSSAPRPDVVGSTAERLIAEQLRIMAMQLQVLGGGVGSSVTGAGPVPGDQQTIGVEPSHHTERATVAPAEPTAPLVGLRGTPPDDRARDAIDDLVRRYGARTRRSRELADRWRPHMADNRTIVGFDRAWKDLVYQIVAERSAGARIWDVDGNELVDTALGFGSIMLGHSHPEVVRAVQAQIKRGFAVGVQSDLLGDVSARILAMSGQERLTYCHSGGEAVETAIRIARTVTGRDEVVYFTDDVHGRADIVLGRRVGSGPEARTMPAVAGVPQHVVDDAYVLDYGSADALERIASRADRLAAVVVEPVRTRNPDLQPVDFLRQIRSLADQHGFLLVMDEVVTGFRAHQRGVQGTLGGLSGPHDLRQGAGRRNADRCRRRAGRSRGRCRRRPLALRRRLLPRGRHHRVRRHHDQASGVLGRHLRGARRARAGGWWAAGAADVDDPRARRRHQRPPRSARDPHSRPAIQLILPPDVPRRTSLRGPVPVLLAGARCAPQSAVAIVPVDGTRRA